VGLSTMMGTPTATRKINATTIVITMSVGRD
jgi:hypothetical protein